MAIIATKYSISREISVVDGDLYQWDSGRKVKITPKSGESCDFVHYHNGMVVKPTKSGNAVLAEIPNILLQTDKKITVYAVMASDDGIRTTERCTFQVIEKPKPDDYVYTETEILSYQTLEKRVTDLENSGGGGGSGKPGFSPIATVTQTEDGAVISITDLNGTTTATVMNGKDGTNGSNGKDGLPGEPGKDGVNGKDGEPGYTPQKGVDYYTEADKADMVQAVLAALPDGDEVSY